MAETLASDQVTLAKVIDGGDIPEELIEKIETASTDAAEAKTDAAQAIEDAEDAAKTASSFITTNDNGAFFHPENDPTNSIRIDGDSIDFYQDEAVLVQIEQTTVNGKNTASIKTNGQPSQIQMAVAEGGMEQSHMTIDGGSVSKSIDARTQLGFKTAVMHASSGLTQSYAELNAMRFDSFDGSVKEALIQARAYDFSEDVTQGGATKIRLEADEITLNRHNIECVGECVSLAGNAGEVTLSTSAANYLTGRCQTWQTSDNYEDVYEVSLNPATIKAKKKGMYLVTLSGYFTTNFTANDIIHINLERQQNGSTTWTAIGFAGYIGRVTNASWYQRVDCVGYISLDVGDTIRMTAYNQTGARGRINVGGNTNLQIIKVY